MIAIPPEGVPPTGRKVQREATRALLLGEAVNLLIERGVAGVTTLEVQQRSGLSRGALLHHFPTRAELLSATVQELVRRNEQETWREQAAQARNGDPLKAAILTVIQVTSTPSYTAEMELWAVSRTDKDLSQTLREAERAALPERERVMAELFACIRDEPAYRTVVDLTMEFARGVGLSNLLRRDPRRGHELVEAWVQTARLIIERAKDPTGGNENDPAHPVPPSG